MDKDVVIKVEGLNKKFCRNLKLSMFYGCLDVARDMLGISRDRNKLRKSEFFALENINFELKKGDALGIIGQNGSGKTTLLRIINGIFPPDKGKVCVRGKIGALIAVGAGFHPHMTGRENVYLNGAILGMTRKEIEQKFQEIIDFADIGEFIDAPVSTYSSGMTIRLGFSIAIHSNPEILLADEVLAVGDLQFALKCFRKITEYKQTGGSVILVSHGIQLVRNTCTNVLWMDHGRVVEYGGTQDVCDKYENYMMEMDVKNRNMEGNNKFFNFDSGIKISEVKFLCNDVENNEFGVGDKFSVLIKIENSRKIINPIFTFTIFNPENMAIISNHSNYDGCMIEGLSSGVHEMRFDMEKIALKPATYTCSVTLSEHEISNQLETHERAHQFSVKNGVNRSFGVINPFPNWNIIK